MNKTKNGKDKEIFDDNAEIEKNEGTDESKEGKISSQELIVLIQKIKDEYETLKKENEQLREKLESCKRQSADIVNGYRILREQLLEENKYRDKSFMRKLCSLASNFRLMNDSVESDLDPKVQAQLKGFQIVLEELEKVMADRGVKMIKIAPYTDIFDAKYHEVSSVEDDINDEYPNNVILKVLRTGYVWNDGSVLQLALVMINRNKKIVAEE